MIAATAVFNRCRRLLIAPEAVQRQDVSPETIKNLLAEISRQFLLRCPVEELFIEGGATAYACFQANGFASLVPDKEYARGVIRLALPGKEKLRITIKPGSYEWPENLFQS
jgi:uncharacterized protein YgbK (DUF1537 family)